MDTLKVAMDEDSCTGSDDLVEYTLEEHDEEQEAVNTLSAEDLDELMEVSSVLEDSNKEEEETDEVKVPTKTMIKVEDLRSSSAVYKSVAAWNEKNTFASKLRNNITMLPQSSTSAGAMKLLNSTQTSLPSTTATTSYRLVNTDGTMVMNVASQPQTMKKMISIPNTTNLMQQSNSKVSINHNARVVHIQPKQLSSGTVIKTVTIAKNSPTALTMKAVPSNATKAMPQTSPSTSSSGAQKTYIHMTKATGSPGVSVVTPRIINSTPANGNNESTKVIIKPGSVISSSKKIVTSPNLQQRFVPAIKGVQYVRVLNQQVPPANGSGTKMIFQTMNKIPSANVPVTAVSGSGSTPVGPAKIILQNNRTYVVHNGIAKVATTVSAPAGKSSSVLPPSRKIILGGENVHSVDKLNTGTTRMVIKKEDIHSTDPKLVRTVVAKFPPTAAGTSASVVQEAKVRLADSKQQQHTQQEKSETSFSMNTSGGKMIEEDIDVSRKSTTSFGFPEEAYKKRPCNCTKSQCLKLYCDCFANGEFCYNCNCKDCYNTFEHENERQKAIRCTLERNPNAFKPKIGSVGATDDGTRLHTKGCNCKRSGCLKNYCECYEAKIPCSSNCKCVGCRNTDQFAQEFNYFGINDLPTKSTDESASQRVAGKHNALVVYSNTGDSVANDGNLASHSVLGGLKRSASFIEADLSELPPAKQPHNFMTLDVIEATVQCMVAQADECLKRGCSIRTSERMILEEYGRCLLEIKEFAFKTDS